MNVPHRYRFTTAAQWQSCLLSGFDTDQTGELVPITPLGLHAALVAAAGPVRVVAVDPYGTPYWRVGADSTNSVLQWQEDPSRITGPFEIYGALAVSPRWIVDRHWLSAFDPDTAQLCRFDRESLQLDLTIVLNELCDAIDDDEYVTPITIVDIAGDGHGGIWLLARSANEIDWLIHFDCDGRLRERRRAPCEVGRSIQIGCIGRGQNLVLLQAGGVWLWLMNATDGGALRSVQLGALAPCWAATRLSSDGRNRIAIGGMPAAPVAQSWSLYLFDGAGDLVDGPFQNLFDTKSAEVPADIAVGAAAIWFALPDGLWRLDGSDASGARASEANLLTPALSSPPTGDSRGWLRAELAIDLPRGAVVQAIYAGTDDDALTGRIAAIAGDTSITSDARQRSIWALLDPPAAQSATRVAGPHLASAPVAIPLFSVQQRWLWLGLKVVTPPGTAAPRVGELRVLYPDVSLMANLPAIFRGEKNDPDGFLRRLVGVLETTTQEIDDRIRSIPRAIDSATAPDNWLDYLGDWLDLPWDDSLAPQAKRCILANAAELLHGRGTRAGLQKLLGSLLGQGGSASIVDLTVEHPPLKLGGRGKPGSRLPTLLAGSSRRVAILNTKAVLGRARLSCATTDCDPLRDIAPTLLIRLQTTQASRAALEPVLPGILAQYLPAGLRVAIRWRLVSQSAADSADGAIEILDGVGPGLLGVDAVIGRAALAGRSRARLDETGLAVGFGL
jgi:phage tail-like protein